MKAAVLVLAGGSGRRLGAPTNKVYLPLAGRSVISHSLFAFAHTPGVERLVLVARADDGDHVRTVLGELPGVDIELATGGATRHASELSGLRHLAPAIASGEIDVVAIHDGARPLVSRDLISRILTTAADVGGAIPGIAVTDLVDRETLAPATGNLVRVQTPQAFRAAELLDAYERAEADGFAGTDTSACVEKFTDLAVACVPGDPANLKVTYAADLPLAEKLLNARS